MDYCDKILSYLCEHSEQLFTYTTPIPPTLIGGHILVANGKPYIITLFSLTKTIRVCVISIPVGAFTKRVSKYFVSRSIGLTDPQLMYTSKSAIVSMLVNHRRLLTGSIIEL